MLFLYKPDWNLISIPNPEEIAIQLFLVQSSLAFLLLLGLKLFRLFTPQIWMRTAQVMAAILLGTQITLQLKSQQSMLYAYKEIFVNYSTAKKYHQYFGSPSIYAEFVLQHIPQPCSGRMITKFDPNETIEPYLLKYFLYPQIDLYNPTENADCLIVYDLTDPASFVPADYQVKYSFDKKSLIAFRRKL